MLQVLDGYGVRDTKLHGQCRFATGSLRLVWDDEYSHAAHERVGSHDRRPEVDSTNSIEL